jgi:outer membrane receptor protein involved in Fe transport
MRAINKRFQKGRGRKSEFGRFGRPAKALGASCAILWLAAAIPSRAEPPDVPPTSGPTTGPSLLPATSTAPATHVAPPMPITPEAAALKRMSLEDLMNIEVGTVTSVSRMPERASDAPATAIVITAQDIQLRGYKYLDDVLRDLPGMETNPYFFSELGTQVAVRGITGNNLIVVLVNGMRVNPPGGEFFPFRHDFGIRDVEQVEVAYGPGSTLYGQDAVSAVINVKTKTPVEGQNGEAGIDGGAYGERDAWFSIGKTFGADHSIKFSGSFQYHDSSLTHVDQDYPNWWSDFLNMSRAATPHGLGQTPYREDYGLNGFVRLEGQNWSVQYWHRESERSSAEGYTTGMPFSNDPAHLSTPGLGYLKQGTWGDQSDVLEGRITIPVSDAVKIDTTLTYNHYQIEPGTRYIEAFFSPNPNNPAHDLTHWNFDDFKEGSGTGISAEETLRWKVTNDLSVLAGVYAGNFDITPKSTDPLGAGIITGPLPPGVSANDLAQNYVYYPQNQAVGKPTLIPRVLKRNYDTYAGYIEATWKLTPTLKAIAGTRITGDTRLSEVPVTPRAALIYDVTPELTAKYIYTQAFVAPAPYFDATYDRGDVLARSNGGLASEKAQSNEVNLAYNRKNLSLSISGYYGRQSNLIQVSDGTKPLSTVYVVLPNGSLSPRGLVESANGGTGKNYGMDLYGRATFGDFSPWASYSFTNFEETLPNGTKIGLPGISRHNGRVGVTWAVTPRLFITPSLVIRSTPENVLPGRLGNELKTPYEVDLNVLYQVSDHVRLFATIENLTDHHYALGDFIGVAYPQETIHGVVGLQVNW